MRRSDVKTVEDLEEYYSKVRKIRFQDNLVIRDVIDIKKYLFDEFAAPTFYNRGGFHCEEDKYRSIDDYFKLCKTYFPNEKLSYFAKIFLDDEKNKELRKEKRLTIRYCPNIRKHNSGGMEFFTYSSYFSVFSYAEKLKLKLQLGFNKKFSLEEIINK